MVTYLFIDIQDKKKLQYLAQKKQLSLSTCCGIIIRHLYVVNDWHNYERNNYIHKGDTQTCIKIRDIQGLTASIATNCIYQFLHEKELNLKFNMKEIKRQIQSEMDKTYDVNANKNLRIRIEWHLKKGNKKK